MLPSARPLPRSCSVTATTCCGAPWAPRRTAPRVHRPRPGRAARSSWSKSWTIEVDGDAARLRRVDVPVVPVGRRREAQRRHRAHRADRALGRPARAAAGTPARSAARGRPAACGRRGSAASTIASASSQRQRQRLLQQHVLAGRERALGVLAVQRRRQADVDQRRRGRRRSRPRGRRRRRRRRPAAATFAGLVRPSARRRPRRGSDRPAPPRRRRGSWPMKPPPRIAMPIIRRRSRVAFRCSRPGRHAASMPSTSGQVPSNSISTDAGPS